MKKISQRTRRRKSRRIVIPDCKHFSGYKPCFPSTRCDEACVEPRPFGKRILIVNLDAMGNVLVTTSLLHAIKRKYPESHVSWITLKVSAPLLSNNPLIDAVHLWEPETWLILQQIKFDIVYSVDKSTRSGALVASLSAKEKLGFGINTRGQIVPLNSEAEYNFSMGLDDHLKFRVNRKTVQQIQCEQFKLKYRRDPYLLNLTTEEEAFCDAYRQQVGIRPDQLVVGFNTGCSELYPNKKMTIEQHMTLIDRFLPFDGIRLVLVGGPEDTERNAEIAGRAGDKVISTPTTEGLRRGLCYVNVCDVLITGDSFGMHAAIALKKHVLVWFGVSCWTEIDLYERGEKFIPHGLECSPCWKRSCPYNLECIQMVNLDGIVAAVEHVKKGWKKGGD